MNNDTIRAAADAMQWVDLLLAVAILVVSLWAWRRWRQARLLLAGLVTVAIHGIAFHVATLAGMVPSPQVSLWSATLRVHIYAFLLATVIVLVVVALSPGWDDDR